MSSSGSPLDGCRLLDFPKIYDKRGSLTFIEGTVHVPFEIKRVYYLYDVPGGEWRAGDEVVVLPSGLRTTVASVETHDGPLEVAVQGQSVVVRLSDDVDVAR